MNKEFFEDLLDDIGNTLRESYDIEPCEDNSNIDLGVIATRAMCVLTGKDDILYWDVIHGEIQNYLKEIKFITIDDIVRRLNDGLDRTEKELEMCKRWLLEFQVANQMTLRELDDLCFEDSDWVFDNIFG